MNKSLLILILFSFQFLTGCTNEQNITNSNISLQNTNNMVTNTQETSVVTEKLVNDAKEYENRINVYHPIIFDGILIGGFRDSKWLKSSEILNFIKGGEKYKLYSINKYIGEALGSKGVPPIENEPDTEKVNIDFPEKRKGSVMAVNGEWNGLPRVPVLQSNFNETYIRIVTDLLKAKGLKNIKVSIKQNYRIDLDGDGIDEVLISAENVSPVSVTTKKNTYSLIILRKIINCKVENILLRDEIYIKDGEFSDGCPILFNIENICDVNGDGVMEVLLGYKYYEGFGYELVEIKSDGFENVLSNGIGV